MNNIKKYRHELHLRLKELSIMSNISPGYLCHLEKGTRNNPSSKVMNNISKALNKSIAEIFFSSG